MWATRIPHPSPPFAVPTGGIRPAPSQGGTRSRMGRQSLSGTSPLISLRIPFPSRSMKTDFYERKYHLLDWFLLILISVLLTLPSGAPSGVMTGCDISAHFPSHVHAFLLYFGAYLVFCFCQIMLFLNCVQSNLRPWMVLSSPQWGIFMCSCWALKAQAIQGRLTCSEGGLRFPWGPVGSSSPLLRVPAWKQAPLPPCEGPTLHCSPLSLLGCQEGFSASQPLSYSLWKWSHF